MEINQRHLGEVIVVSVSGRLADMTLETAVFHDCAIHAAHSAAAYGNAVVFDFSNVEWINSVALRTLMLAVKQTRPAGTKLAVAALQPNVREKFDISRFGMVIPVYGTVSEAIAAFAAQDKPAT